MENRTYSILYPDTKSEYKVISAVTLHDLGMDQICKQLSAKTPVQNLILNIMSKITDDPYVTQYRCDVFEDILQNRKMREDMLEILGRIDFLKEYGGFQREYDEGASMWELMHRLDEIKDYIGWQRMLTYGGGRGRKTLLQSGAWATGWKIFCG